MNDNNAESPETSKMSSSKLREIQAAFAKADANVTRGPLQKRLIMSPHFKIHIAGHSFPGWVGELGANPLPPGELVSRYKGSDPSAEDPGPDAEKQGYWLIHGPVRYVVEWYEAWLALVDAEKRLAKGE